MSLVTYGLGPGPGEEKFTMRAWHTTVPIGYVFWTVDGTPDPTGTFAPYPAINLIDFVVVDQFIPDS